MKLNETDTKSESSFRVCSVATPITALLSCTKMANYGTAQSSLIFSPTAAILLAALQVKIEPFRNGIFEMRNELVKRGTDQQRS